MRDADFDRLYEEHAEPLFAFLVYRTGNRTLAEDMVAETFVRVLGARRPFDRRKASAKTWLYTIALNLLRDHLRRQAAEGRALERAGADSHERNRGPSVGSVEARDNLQHALEGLSAEERETVALRYGADLTLPEIAKVIGERLTTAEGRLYRALRKLRDELS